MKLVYTIESAHYTAVSARPIGMNAQHPLSNGETGNDLLKHNKRTDGHPCIGVLVRAFL